MVFRKSSLKCTFLNFFENYSKQQKIDGFEIGPVDFFVVVRNNGRSMAEMPKNFNFYILYIRETNHFNCERWFLAVCYE